MSKFNLDKAVNDVAKYQKIEIKGKAMNKHQDKIDKVCKRYHVSLLYIFGSVLTKKFNKDSDIDFIVYFEQIPILDYADNFFDFITELESLQGITRVCPATVIQRIKWELI